MLLELSLEARNFFGREADLKRFHCLTSRYNLSPGSMHYLAISNKPFQGGIGLSFALTKSGFFYEGERDKTHLDETYEEYEKSMFRVRSANGTLIFATHLGLGNEAKLKQTQKIIEILTKVVPKDNVKCVLGGDFNCFDRDSAEPKYLEGVVDELASAFCHQTALLTSTFDNRHFPYDIEFRLSAEKRAAIRGEVGAEKYRQLLLRELEHMDTKGLALDHIFTNFHQAKVSTFHAPHLSDHDAIIAEF